MARKVFISFLGFSNYEACFYCKDDYKSPKVRYIQEATLEYLMQEEQWSEDDIAIILLTKGAEQRNWLDNGHKNRNTQEIIEQTGLQSQLQKKKYPMTISPIYNLPDGNNEEEIWDIFMLVYGQLREGDEVYFDITHAFRYLPMLVIVLCNYAKFLKNIKVKHVSYGNFEGRNRETNEAMIVDLFPMTVLQDWTFAAANFLKNGYVDDLSVLANKTIRPMLALSKGKDINAKNIKEYVAALERVIDERLLCRGIQIVKSENFAKLHSISEKARQSNVIKPLTHVIEKINDSFDDFSVKENISNGFAASRWCLDNHLYQQAVTILQESLVTLVCQHAGLNWESRIEREYVNKAFAIKVNNTPEEGWVFSSNLQEEEIARQKGFIRGLVESELIDCFSSTFMVCTNIRNDYNHAGMRDNPMSAGNLRRSIEERILKVEEILKELQICL